VLAREALYHLSHTQVQYASVDTKMKAAVRFWEKEEGRMPLQMVLSRQHLFSRLGSGKMNPFFSLFLAHFGVIVT
jgi:hypothetical protein